MNAIIQNMVERRSIRSYLDKPVPRDLIEQVLQAAIYAPTGMGWQSPRIVAVTNRVLRDRLSQLNAQVMGVSSDPFYGAPVVLVVLADRTRPTYLYDGSLVIGNMLNAAHSLGLGSCWIHRAKEVFESSEGKELLSRWGITGDYEGIGHCILGFPAAAASVPKPRKADYIHWVE